MRRAVARVATLVLTLGGPLPALAQSFESNPADSASIHLGPLALTPRFGVRDVGIDTNVLNSSGNPVQDFTATFATGADAWFSVGRGRLSSKTDLGWVYYQQLASQRSFEFGEQARLDFLLARVVPYVNGGYDHTRQRPNLEIDARALRTTTTFGGGAVVRLSARWSVDLNAASRDYEFAQDEAIQDIRLAKELNRTEQQVGATLRVMMTPLTTLVLAVTDEHDRFAYSPVRDSNSVKVLPGFEFTPFALISGKVSVGYRQFNALNENVPDYSGLVALVDASYTMRESTRFAISFARDLEYSYEVTSPYYVSNGGTVTVTQALGPTWSLIGRAGRTTLEYQSLVGLGTPIEDLTTRNDRVLTYGFGCGRLVRSDIHLTINADWTTRNSIALGHNYSGVKVGGSVTYGF